MPIGYGNSQNAVYAWLKEHRALATSKEVGVAFGKSTKWAYSILISLENAYRICGTLGERPIRWQVTAHDPLPQSNPMSILPNDGKWYNIIVSRGIVGNTIVLVEEKCQWPHNRRRKPVEEVLRCPKSGNNMVHPTESKDWVCMTSQCHGSNVDEAKK